MIDLADARVESPNAAESRGQGNLIHRQSRLVDQPFCELQTARLSYGPWSRAQMFQEQAPQVPRSNSEPLRQKFYSTVLQPTLADQT
jgi:hypothetical protein